MNPYYISEIVTIILLAIIAIQNFKTNKRFSAQEDGINFLVQERKTDNDNRLLAKLVELAAQQVAQADEDREYRKASLQLKRDYYNRGYKESFRDTPK